MKQFNIGEEFCFRPGRKYNSQWIVFLELLYNNVTESGSVNNELTGIPVLSLLDFVYDNSPVEHAEAFQRNNPRVALDYFNRDSDSRRFLSRQIPPCQVEAGFIAMP